MIALGVRRLLVRAGVAGKWTPCRRPGARVRPGDALGVLVTDVEALDVLAPCAGRVARVLMPAGERVDLWHPLVEIVADA